MITLTTYDWVPEFVQPIMRAMRVRWALEEAGLPYDVRTISLGPEQKSPGHLAMQPFGQAPAIEENGLVLFESGAIALYIAEKSPALLPSDPLERDRATAWLFAALNSVEMWSQQLYMLDVFYGQEQWSKEARPHWEQLVRARMASLSQVLGGKDYLEGAFSVGDLMMADVLRVIDHAGMLADYPVMRQYRERCEARPAFQRAMEAQMKGFKKAA